MKSVEIPESVTELGGAAFYYCQNLSQVTLNANIDEIQSSTFAGCSALTDITIPASVKKIGMRAFEECSKLDTIILLSQNIEQIGQNAFSQTQYSKDLSNWENGVLKLGELVIGVDSQNENIMIKSDAIIAPDAFENCYKLKNLSLGGDYISLLAPLSNIETLIIQKMPSHPISFYFGRSPSVPLTLNKIVLCKGVNVYQQSFEKITGITIFVEGSKEDCPWDKVYPGWNNGNRVIYGDDWSQVSYYDADGELLATHQYTTNEVIKPPHLYSHTDKQDAYVFMGWDADGDGIADALPATLNRDYELRAVYQKTEAQYRVEYMDKDGKTVLHSYLLPYGAEIPTVADPVKKGYTFIGWSGIPATVTEDVRIYSEWRHTGNGHEYQTSVVEPSCTVDGYTLHTCSVCDESYKTDVIKATGHNFGDWEVTRKADCKKQGSMYRECACGQKETQVIERTPHEYVETHRVESTCKQPGKLTLSCKHCNDKAKSDLPLRQHEYQEKHAKRHALDSFLKKYDKLMYGMRGDDEIYYYECSGCNRVRTHENERSQSHGAAGVMSVGCAHVPSDWQILIAPTCVEYGANVQACTLCQEVLDVQLVENTANSHISADAVEQDRKEPTCTETGGYDSVVYCITCGEELGREHVEIPANGHTSADIVIENRVEPTCTEHGSCDNVTYCSACDAELSREHVVLDALGHNHNATVTAPTCTEQGYTTYTCHCGDVYVDAYVPANGHTEIVDEAVDPTCTENGLTEGVHCDVCGEVLVAQTVVVALGHTEVIDAAVAPDCENTGLTEGKHCDVCGEVLVVQTVVDALGHTEVIDAAVVPDCENTGLTEGKHCDVCGEVLVAQELVAALGHEEVIDAAVAPTCTETGLTEGKYCSVCNEVLVAQETVNALGHTAVTDAAVAPDCTETGLTEGKHCSVCGEVLVAQETVNALGHTAVTDAAVAPDCTETGLTEGKHCDVCGEVLVAQETVDALGHNEVVDEAVDPTCTENGLTEGVHCAVCNATLVPQAVISAYGHDYSFVETEPTCTENGYATYTCSVCGDTYVDHEVEALGHTPSDWITDTEPQIGVPGSKHKACTVCGEILETATMDALTEAPTTEEPTTDAPTTEAPTTEEPTTEEPTTEEPTTEAPITDAPSTDTPTTDAESNEQGTEPKDEGGCNGSLSAAFSCMMLIAFAAVAVTTKKKY